MAHHVEQVPGGHHAEGAGQPGALVKCNVLVEEKLVRPLALSPSSSSLLITLTLPLSAFLILRDQSVLSPLTLPNTIHPSMDGEEPQIQGLQPAPRPCEG